MNKLRNYMVALFLSLPVVVLADNNLNQLAARHKAINEALVKQFRAREAEILLSQNGADSIVSDLEKLEQALLKGDLDEKDAEKAEKILEKINRSYMKVYKEVRGHNFKGPEEKFLKKTGQVANKLKKLKKGEVSDNSEIRQESSKEEFIAELQ